MVTGERCSNELRGFRRKSFCIEMSLGGEGSHTDSHFLLFVSLAGESHLLVNMLFFTGGEQEIYFSYRLQ